MTTLNTTAALNHLADQAKTSADRAIHATQAATNDALESLAGSVQGMRAKASHSCDNAAAYIQEEPLKAVLIAAATGAALMALLSLMARSRHQ